MEDEILDGQQKLGPLEKAKRTFEFRELATKLQNGEGDAADMARARALYPIASAALYDDVDKNEGTVFDNVRDGVYRSLVNSTIQGFASAGAGIADLLGADELERKMDRYADIRATRAEMADVVSEGTFADRIGEVIGYSVPSVIGMAAAPYTGGTSAAWAIGSYFGAQAFGQGRQAVREAMGSETNDIDELIGGLMYGSAELLAERYGFGIIRSMGGKALAKTAAKLRKAGMAADPVAYATLTRALPKAIAMTSAENMVEESLTEWMNNVTDRYLTAIDPDGSLLDGIQDAAINGLLMGPVSGPAAVMSNRTSRKRMMKKTVDTALGKGVSKYGSDVQYRADDGTTKVGFLEVDPEVGASGDPRKDRLVWRLKDENGLVIRESKGSSPSIHSLVGDLFKNQVTPPNMKFGIVDARIPGAMEKAIKDVMSDEGVDNERVFFAVKYGEGVVKPVLGLDALVMANRTLTNDLEQAKKNIEEERRRKEEEKQSNEDLLDEIEAETNQARGEQQAAQQAQEDPLAAAFDQPAPAAVAEEPRVEEQQAAEPQSPESNAEVQANQEAETAIPERPETGELVGQDPADTGEPGEVGGEEPGRQVGGQEAETVVRQATTAIFSGRGTVTTKDRVDGLFRDGYDLSEDGKKLVKDGAKPVTLKSSVDQLYSQLVSEDYAVERAARNEYIGTVRKNSIVKIQQPGFPAVERRVTRRKRTGTFVLDDGSEVTAGDLVIPGRESEPSAEYGVAIDRVRGLFSEMDGLNDIIEPARNAQTGLDYQLEVQTEARENNPAAGEAYDALVQVVKDEFGVQDDRMARDIAFDAARGLLIPAETLAQRKAVVEGASEVEVESAVSDEQADEQAAQLTLEEVEARTSMHSAIAQALRKPGTRGGNGRITYMSSPGKNVVEIFQSDGKGRPWVAVDYATGERIEQEFGKLSDLRAFVRDELDSVVGDRGLTDDDYLSGILIPDAAEDAIAKARIETALAKRAGQDVVLATQDTGRAAAPSLRMQRAGIHGDDAAMVQRWAEVIAEMSGTKISAEHVNMAIDMYRGRVHTEQGARYVAGLSDAEASLVESVLKASAADTGADLNPLVDKSEPAQTFERRQEEHEDTPAAIRGKEDVADADLATAGFYVKNFSTGKYEIAPGLYDEMKSRLIKPKKPNQAITRDDLVELTRRGFIVHRGSVVQATDAIVGDMKDQVDRLSMVIDRMAAELTDPGQPPINTGISVIAGRSTGFEELDALIRDRESIATKMGVMNEAISRAAEDVARQIEESGFEAFDSTDDLMFDDPDDDITDIFRAKNLSKKQVADRMHAAGRERFGAEGWELARPKFTAWAVSKSSKTGRTSSTELSKAEMWEITKRIEGKGTKAPSTRATKFKSAAHANALDEILSGDDAHMQAAANEADFVQNKDQSRAMVQWLDGDVLNAGILYVSPNQEDGVQRAYMNETDARDGVQVYVRAENPLYISDDGLFVQSLDQLVDALSQRGVQISEQQVAEARALIKEGASVDEMLEALDAFPEIFDNFDGVVYSRQGERATVYLPSAESVREVPDVRPVQKTPVTDTVVAPTQDDIWATMQEASHLLVTYLAQNSGQMMPAIMVPTAADLPGRLGEYADAVSGAKAIYDPYSGLAYFIAEEFAKNPHSVVPSFLHEYIAHFGIPGKYDHVSMAERAQFRRDQVAIEKRLDGLYARHLEAMESGDEAAMAQLQDEINLVEIAAVEASQRLDDAAKDFRDLVWESHKNSDRMKMVRSEYAHLDPGTEIGRRILAEEYIASIVDEGVRDSLVDRIIGGIRQNILQTSYISDRQLRYVIASAFRNGFSSKSRHLVTMRQAKRMSRSVPEDKVSDVRRLMENDVAAPAIGIFQMPRVADNIPRFALGDMTLEDDATTRLTKIMEMRDEGKRKEALEEFRAEWIEKGGTFNELRRMAFTSTGRRVRMVVKRLRMSGDMEAAEKIDRIARALDVMAGDEGSTVVVDPETGNIRDYAASYQENREYYQGKFQERLYEMGEGDSQLERGPLGTMRLNEEGREHHRQVVRDINNGVYTDPAARDIHNLLNDLWDYMKAAGVINSKIRFNPRYFPREFNYEKIAQDEAGFVADLTAALMKKIGPGADAELSKEYAQAVATAIMTRDESQLDALMNTPLGRRMVDLGILGAEDPGLPKFLKRRRMFIDYEMMDQWMNTNVYDVLNRYIMRSVSYTEMFKKFGADMGAEQIMELQRMAADRETSLNREDVQLVSSLIQASMGEYESDKGFNRFKNAAKAVTIAEDLTSMSVMSLVLFSATSETVAPIIRMGVNGLKGLASFLPAATGADTRSNHIANELGVVSRSVVEEIQQAFSLANDNIMDAKRPLRPVTSWFYRLNLLQWITRTQRRLATSGARIHIREILEANELTARQRRDATHLGIPTDRAGRADMLAWLDSYESGSTGNSMGDSQIAQAYGVAVQRLVRETIVHPTASTKPLFMSSQNPIKRLAGQLQGFAAAFREGPPAYLQAEFEAAKLAGEPVEERWAMLLRMLPFFILTWLMPQIKAEVVYNISDEDQDTLDRIRSERSDLREMLTSIAQSGAFGGLQRVVGAFESYRYGIDGVLRGLSPTAVKTTQLMDATHTWVADGDDRAITNWLMRGVPFAGATPATRRPLEQGLQAVLPGSAPRREE